ncbi:MAG TPA: hypothetical protein VMZ90_14980 [Vicinamibacterales bacterium]|nr:hypothetical protein [Vicinamibacterales bacterium]
MQMKTVSFALLLAIVTVAAAEPAPRKPSGQIVKTASPLPYISGVAELPDGRLLVSDHKTPRLAVIVPATGVVTPVGSTGASSGQYVRPGGFYGTPGKGFWLLDRGLTRVSAVSASGELTGSKSILPRGSSGSSDADYDLQHLDARGMAYYFDRDSRLRATATTGVPMVDLIRFDPATQARTVIAKVQQRVTQTMAGGDGVTYSRAIIGSPADGWGVAADGRVAVVRATPYRVDWYSPAGVESRGPVYQLDVVPMTEADKQAHIAANAGEGVSVGMAAAPGSASPSGLKTVFADTKAPFDPEHVLVSPAGRVFVPRSAPLEHPEVIYDIFDGRGQRVDRILLPANSRIVGFGPAAIYVREGAGAGFTLKKYEVK